MAIFSPLFCKGKANQKTVSTFTRNASSTTILLTATASPIAVGNHVFVSDSNGLLCEYLGKATAVAGSTITTRYRGQRTRAGGALVWTPAASWQAASLPSADIVQSTMPGIENLDTTGATPVRSRTAEDRELLSMNWNLADRSDWKAWRDWLKTNTDNGLTWFSAAYVNQDSNVVGTSAVCLAEPSREIRAEPTAWVLRTWPLVLYIALADSYV